MAGAAGGGFGGIVTGIVVGGFCLLGLIMTAIAATIIFSIIATFTQPAGQTPYGDQFQCYPLMLKSLYTNTSYTFSNGFIAANPTLNTLCTSEVTNLGQTNVAGCVIDNHTGWGPYLDSPASKRRRRQEVFGWSGLYSISRGRIFFSTTCGERADRGRYANNASSTCVKNRLNALNSLFNNTATNFTEWTPVSSLSYTIVNTSASYVSIAINKVFGVRTTNAMNYTQYLSNSGFTAAQFAAGCQYIGPMARSDISGIIAAQSTQTTTQATTTPFTG